MASRAGKATIHLNMPISNAKKAMDRKAMGLGLKTGEDPTKKKEIMPGLRALRQKRALMINQPEVVSSNFKSDDNSLTLF